MVFNKTAHHLLHRWVGMSCVKLFKDVYFPTSLEAFLKRQWEMCENQRLSHILQN